MCCLLNTEYSCWSLLSKNSIDNCKKKLKFKIECKGQIYKTADIILLYHKVLCLFCTVIFTGELIAKRHSLSCHDSSKKRTSPQKTAVNRSSPNLAYRVPSPTWSSMPIFLAIGLGVLNMWGIEFCHFHISRRSPLTQCWRYRAACESINKC